MKKFLLPLVTALALVFGAIPATAEVITQWQYTVDGVYSSWASRDGNLYNTTDTVAPGNNESGLWGDGAKTLNYDLYQGQPSPDSVTGYSELHWGTRNALGGLSYSSISLEAASGALFTNGEAGNGLKISHNNQIINGSPSTLQYGTVLATLALTPAGGSALPVFAATLEFHFLETPNGDSATEEDIFLVRNPYVGTETFTYEGELYTFTFQASFKELTGWYADYARRYLGWAADAPVYGWTTTERNHTDFLTQVQIKHTLDNPTPTPEPTALALMGLGLLGLALTVRRKRT